MKNLSLQIEVLDFDLDRIGFMLSVLGGGKQVEKTSEGYMRMTLLELNAFIDALKAAKNTVRLVDKDQRETSQDKAASPKLMSVEDMTEAEMAAKLSFSGKQ